MPERPVAPGLYLVATPIGNLRDITLRALDTLRAADTIACEDTRVTRKLLTAHGIAGRLTAYHDHNAATAGPALIDRVEAGEVVALVSDAGTPLNFHTDATWQEMDLMVGFGFPPMEVLVTATRRNAEYLGLGDELGSLTPGKLADIVVLSQDIMTIPEDDIPATEVVYTIVGGEVRYSGPES